MYSTVTYVTIIHAASFFVTSVSGYEQGCAVNQTLFVPEGSNATFQTNCTSHGIMYITFRNDGRYLVDGYILDVTNITDDDINALYIDYDFEKRTYIHIDGQGIYGTHMTVTIIVTDVGTADNGTYDLSGYYIARVCWILFVMEIKQRPAGFVEENQPVYLFGNPPASLMIRPLVNATMVWLQDGMNINQTARYVEQDGSIWIPRVRRYMDGMTVTYRSVQDNGEINEVNYTLDVTYGPSGPLLLTPSNTQYFLTSGELMTNIACTADCKPQCTVTWGEHNQGSILDLGTVTSKNTGEYTCTATRTGSNAVVEKRIIIYVADEPVWLLALMPKKTAYFLNAGDEMPDISCTADCHPACEVSWNSHGTNEHLKLGVVSTDTAGEYTCSATRIGSDRRVDKSITVYVQDNAALTFALASLASVLVLTVGIGIASICFLLRRKTSPCQSCHKLFTSKAPSTAVPSDAQGNSAQNTLELEHYEDLKPETRHTPADNHYELVNHPGSHSNDGMVYENTKIA